MTKKRITLNGIKQFLIVIIILFFASNFAYAANGDVTATGGNEIEFRIQCDNGSYHHDIIEVKLDGATLFVLSDGTRSYSQLTYIDVDDSSVGWDGYYDSSKGSFQWTLNDSDGGNDYYYVTWTPNLSAGQILSFTYESTDESDSNNNTSDSFDVVFLENDFPGPENFEVSFDDDGNGVLSWTESQFFTIAMTDLSSATCETVVTNDGTDITPSIAGGTTTFTDNGYGDYSIRHEITYNSTTYISAEVSVDSQDLPLVDMPVGVKASTGTCDGIINVTWDYNGQYAPENFIINVGGTEITLPGDAREYNDNVGDHTSKTYSVKAVGTINISEYSSQTTGNTFGNPPEPTGFTATVSGTAIDLSWNDASHENKYLIKRTSAEVEMEFEVSEDESSYTDNKTKGCVGYSYQLYASNKCTTEEGLIGVMATNQPSATIEPELGAYITNIDASKAYFPDKVLIEWTVKDDNAELVDRFEVFRSLAGENNFKYLATVEGGVNYEDKSSVSSLMYEYEVIGKLQCDTKVLESNTLTAPGFRIPYGIVTGHIEFESGIAVENVEVLAEKSSGATGKSLQFNGSTQVSVNNAANLNPSSEIMIEAWIKPNSTTSGDIINKGNYRLYLSSGKVYFNIPSLMTNNTVEAAITAGEWTHVAGVYDGAELKIFINGRIPYDTKYVLHADDITSLEAMELPQDVTDALSDIVDTEFTNSDPDIAATNFQALVESKIGTIQTELYAKFIMPLAKIETDKPTAIKSASASISSSSGSLIIGNSYNGYIDEIRIWSAAKTNDMVGYDHKRMLANDEENLVAYWRCDENFGNKIYDCSKTGNDFNKNDGTYSTSTLVYSVDIPAAEQLGWAGVTDDKGDYIIPYMPYYASGEIFNITPRYGGAVPHEFSPTQKAVFIGEGANIVSDIDFIDKSSFKVTGTVVYEDFLCPVEGVMLLVDGAPVIKDYNYVYTDAEGKFEITVPVGNHIIEVKKEGHVFKSSTFPPTGTYNYQDMVTGINFIDQTRVKIVGRVVGGTREGDKKPGLGLSVNNIGVAEWTFKSTIKLGCAEYPIVTDSQTGEYEVWVHPMPYIIEGFTVANNLDVDAYFNNIFPKSDFTEVPDTTTVEYVQTDTQNGTVTIDRTQKTATISIGSEQIQTTVESVSSSSTDEEKVKYQYNLRTYYATLEPLPENITTVSQEFPLPNPIKHTAEYQYRYDLIYRATPQLSVFGDDGETQFSGDDEIQWEDRKFGKTRTFDVKANPFLYPVITQMRWYKMLIAVDEVYYNYDSNAPITEDYVAVEDGVINIHNECAAIIDPQPLELVDGKAWYRWIGGFPNTMKDINYPYRSYTNVINIAYESDGNGKNWEPNASAPLQDDKYFRAYVLGKNPIDGSDFVTNGPDLVDMVLRDPPGSGSYSFFEEGNTTKTITKTHFGTSVSAAFGSNAGGGLSLITGTYAGTPVGGTVNLNKFETETGLEINASVKTEYDYNGEQFEETTWNKTIKTSSAPELAGALSDLFIGKSHNFIVSAAEHLAVFEFDFANTNGISTAGTVANDGNYELAIGLSESLIASPDSFQTMFIYSQDHIKNYLIPNLKKLRNYLFVQKPDVYESYIPATHDMYGSNNDDTRWYDIYELTPSSPTPITTEAEDADGHSYKFTPEKEGDFDEVRRYNQQIRLWEEALENNERDKYHSKYIENISFSAGSEYEYTKSTTSGKSNSYKYEVNVGLNLKKYFKLNSFTNIEFNWEVGSTIGGGNEFTTIESDWENPNNFVLYDPNNGDYFSVDICDPQNGTGTVFKTKGGRSLCPHEGPVDMEYYVPQKFIVSEEGITALKSFDGLTDETIIKILNWKKHFSPFLTNKYSVNKLNNELSLNLDSDFLDNAGNVELETPTIFDVTFETDYELRAAIYEMIDIHLNLDPEDPDIDPEEIGEGGSDSDLTDYWGEQNGTQVYYLFKKEKREELKAEVDKFWYNIKDRFKEISGNNDIEISTGTIRREVPSLKVYPAEVYNVPDDNKAYLTLQLGNLSHTNETQWYAAKILPESNPNGAIILMDGVRIGAEEYEIPPNTYLNKTISVEIGRPDVFDYEDLQIVLYSACEWAYHTNGAPIADLAIDTVSFSVHFVPSCTDINVFKPSDNFVVNYEDQKLVDGVKKTFVPTVMSGYEQGGTLKDISFEFKFLSEENWIVEDKFYTTPDPAEEDQKPIEGKYQGLEWNLSGFPDGMYAIRAHSFCGRDPETNAAVFDLSEEFIGMVDRKPPKLFGTPSPADGILQPNDEISISFNEDIFGEKLFHLANFDLRGVLNGSDLRHSASVGFNGTEDDFVRIPDGIVLTDKQFTIEFWAKRGDTFDDMCIVSQGSNPDNSMYIGFNAANQAVFHVGDKTITTNQYPVPNPYIFASEDPYTGIDWHHWAYVYDIILKKALIYIDGKLVDSQPIDTEFESFGPIVLGKRLFEDYQPFNGKLHELRIWSTARTASQLTANMLITLSGKERGLLGYWQLNECKSDLALEKVRKLHATVNAPWRVEPEGYAAKFTGGTASIDVKAPALAFNEEQNFTIEFWFKGGDDNDGKEVCLFSNGKGDGTDPTVYILNPSDLFYLDRTLPLSTITQPLDAMKNEVYANETSFMTRVYDVLNATDDLDATKYKEQIIRFAKKPTTYWSINTDADGNIYVNNNGQAMKITRAVEDPAIEKTNWFDDKWHHFAMVVERAGNTRVYIDNELLGSKASDKWNGFGAAQMSLGCRSWYNLAVADFEKEQFFTGEIDEFRVWNMVKKQEQIEKDMSSRLRGDEFGLAAYIPFEEYEEVMNVPILNEKLYDVADSESTDLFISGTVDLQQEDQPTIKLHRPVSNVDYDYTFDERNIVFTIKDPPARVENCIIDITVKDVEDMYGNKMSSPVTWSAYIDMNQMKWNTDKLSFDKLVYAPLEFTAEIINSSGKQQHYSIENLPSWLTASPREGNLEPLSTQTVTFTVNDGLNVGYYNNDIYLQTDFEFDEKLNVNLRVYEPVPTAWNFNPNDFQYSMNMIAQLKIGNVISIDKYDMLGAFVDGECRGYAYLEYIEEYDMYEVFLTVFSNKTTENFDLRIWDASEGVEFSKVTVTSTDPIVPVLPTAPVPYQNQFVFTNNNLYGYPSTPLMVETEGLIRQTIPLAKGWNWISFNLDIDATKPLSVQLKGLEPKTGDIIKTESQYTQYTPPIGWNGTLKELGNTEMFMFYVDEADTLEIQGEAVNVNDIPVDIHQNWNRISYLPQENMTVADAFASFTPNHGAVVKNQFAFAMFDRYMGWLGSLKYMRPNEGYMLHYNNDGTFLPESQTFFYPKTGSLSKSGEVNSEKLQTVYRANAQNMTILAEVIGLESLIGQTGQVGQADSETGLTAAVIGVFAGDNCVGYGTPTKMTDERTLFFVTANANTDVTQLTFKLLSGASSTLQGGGQNSNAQPATIEFSETTPFFANEMLGTFKEPFILNANSKDELTGASSTLQGGGLLLNIYPNPFKSSVNFEFNIKNKSDVMIEIFDVTGRKIESREHENVESGKHNVEWDSRNIAVGVYTVKIKFGNEHFTRKIVKTE